MGKYTTQHEKIGNALQSVKVSTDAVFAEVHNGDSKKNNLVRQMRDDVMKAKSLFEFHQDDTSGYDMVILENRVWRGIGAFGFTVLGVLFREEIMNLF